MTKTERIKEFFRICLEEDTTNEPRDIPLKDAVAHFGLGVLMVLGIGLHLVLCAWQLTVALLLVGHDLLVAVLKRFFPVPKVAKEVKQ
jgi:hypothetical protein